MLNNTQINNAFLSISFSLSTGSKILENGLLFKELLQTPNFRITVVDDADTVELCGALKVRLTSCSLYTKGMVILLEKRVFSFKEFSLLCFIYYIKLFHNISGRTRWEIREQHVLRFGF